ncbi:DHS-like NAD/FAD-binding domain-containing protein [Rhypophila decipiens]|uniref:protein acetyllysine N-acetyltransferase n=1 Tax=Rhypophila decipiens TaxID=261697 RepID=A0AAN7AZD2_9PEZI|nr:DHS-like NAD/FAD-binding domain-containing protein [Rhypophila decipiens]
MADSAPAIAEEEKHEPSHILDRKAESLAKLISQSKHMIVFTGAGISTSAGIPDFRGPEGAWTLRKQGRERTSQTTSTLQAIPTPSHMALVALQNAGLLKYLVSQNCDGLHRKSGILPGKISELHGNSNRESCRDCGKEYIRDFRAVAKYEKTVHDHRTGRKCAMSGCKGVLVDTIINFGEQLPEEPHRLARQHAETADLCLVLGSSLTVTPANEIPEIVGRRKKAAAKLVICNLQSTPIDSFASLRVFAWTDELMVRVMEKLGVEVPVFVLRRRLVVEVKVDSGSERHSVRVYGLDVDDTPASFLKSVRLEYNRRCITREPFLINFRGGLEEDLGMKLRLELEFMGHYGEPNLEIVHDLTEAKEQDGELVKAVYLLGYNPQNGEWETTLQS